MARVLAIDLHQYVPELHGRSSPAGPEERRPQVESQHRVDHSKQIVGGFTAAELQKSAGIFGHMDNIVILIDHQRRWSHLLEQAKMKFGE